MSLHRLMQEEGYTLIELLVVMPMLMVTIILITSYLFNQFGALSQQNAQLNLQLQANTITLSMQDDVYFASAFTSDKNDNLSDSYAPPGGWSSATTPPTFIISEAALTTNRRDPARKPVYINTEGCSADVIEQNSVLYNNVIYFVSGTNLYKRNISAPPSMNTCGSSYVKQTCPAANATSTCLADKRLTDQLQSFSVTYYNQGNTVVTTPEQATRVQVTIQLKDRAYATDIFASSSISLRKLNL